MLFEVTVLLAEPLEEELGDNVPVEEDMVYKMDEEDVREDVIAEEELFWLAEDIEDTAFCTPGAVNEPYRPVAKPEEPPTMRRPSNSPPRIPAPNRLPPMIILEPPLGS